MDRMESVSEMKIITILEFFETRDKTYQNWLNCHNQDNSSYEFIDLLFQQGLLCISGLTYVPMSEARAKHTDLRNSPNISKIIFVTKEGYAFLSSYRFNKRSLQLNEQMKILTIITIVLAIVSVVGTVVDSNYFLFKLIIAIIGVIICLKLVWKIRK